MPYEATVFNVIIASPSDVQVERNIVRDVVHEWNAIHSITRKIVLQPVGWETHSAPTMGDRPQAIINKQIVKNSDLLVAIFWTRLGTPTGEAASGTVEEIREHMEAGKPAMIYFSSAPVRLDSVNEEQYQALRDFKQKCETEGLIEVYDNTTDFRQKLGRHLASILNTHAYFKEHGAGTESEFADRIDSRPSIPELSKEALGLLLEATVDPEGSILRFRHLTGVLVQTNGKQFAEDGNPRSQAVWEGAVDELAENRLIEDLSYKGEAYRVTRLGFETADLLRPKL